MFLLLMIFLERNGYTLWRTNKKYSTSSRNSKTWLRITQKRRLRNFDQVMAENSHQMNSKSYAKTHGLRGSFPLLTIHNRMGLQKSRIELSWKLREQCFMINIFLCIFGRKMPEQWCMYKTVLHIEYSRTRLLKKYSPARIQKSSISDIQLSSRHTHSKREED